MPDVIVPIGSPLLVGGWGREALHIWNDEELILNGIDEFPCYRVTKIDGLRGTADVDLQADAATGKIGEIPRGSARRGKTVVYSGFVEAQNRYDLRHAEQRMIAAFDATGAEKKMLIQPHPLLDSGSRYYYARPASCLIPDETSGIRDVRANGYRSSFALSLRLSDPRTYDTEELEVEAGGFGSGAVATNWVYNPRGFRGEDTGWLVGDPLFTPSQMPYLDGLPAGVDTGFTFASDADDENAQTLVPVTNGEDYVLSAYILPIQLLGGADIQLEVMDQAGSTSIATSSLLSDVGPWQRLTVDFTAAATENYRIKLRQKNAGSLACYITAVQLEEGDTPTAFHDGDMPFSDWEGDPEESESTRRARLDLVCESNGLAWTDPQLVVEGFAENPVIRHRELDRVLSFEGLTLGAGQSLVVDFQRQRFLLNGLIPSPNLLDYPNTDWWDEAIPGLVPGENTLEVYAGTGIGGFSATWHDAYPS